LLVASHDDDFAASFAANFEHLSRDSVVSNRVFGSAALTNDLHRLCPMRASQRRSKLLPK
jgi:hypothetical protein